MTSPDLLFYDGGCGLCHRTVRFVIRHDRDGSRFRFAPIDGRTFQATFGHPPAGSLPDSVIVRTVQGETLVRSAAILHVGRRLGGRWRALARLVDWLPGRLLDAVYDGVARVRYRIFARPADACPVVPGRLRGRFEE